MIGVLTPDEKDEVKRLVIAALGKYSPFEDADEREPFFQPQALRRLYGAVSDFFEKPKDVCTV